MPHSALKSCHIVAIGQWKTDWPQPKVKKWVEEAGGKVTAQEKLTDETTHVVLLEKTWRDQGIFVKKILAAKENGDREIHIVNFDWLQDSLQARSKRRESLYSYERMQRDLDVAARKADKEKAKIEKSLQPRSGAGLMAQVYTESTDPFVSEIEKKRSERYANEMMRVREEKKAEEKLIAEKTRERHGIKELSAIFRRGVSRARNELLSENHHVYMDQSGFHYDIVITKIAFKSNRNHRHVLTIYESNELPNTYAFNCQYSGTNVEVQNNIIATLGSNWPTAFRAFKKVFKEKTGVEWKDRIKDARERFDREKRGFDDGRAPEAVDFEKAPFIYHPPLYGSRGADLEDPALDESPSAKPAMVVEEPPPGSREASPEVNGNGVVTSPRELSPGVDGTVFMSGANGNGAVTPLRESAPAEPLSANPNHEIAEDDAFEKLIAGTEGMPDGLDFLGDTAFTEPFDFDETNFDEAMTDGNGAGQEFVNETQTQPSSQLPDTQDMSDTQPNFEMPEIQEFDNTQQASQVPEGQSFGHTQAAEEAHAYLMAFVGEVKQERPSSSDRELFGEGKPEVELGGSVLGKRKNDPEVTAEEEGVSSKKLANGQSKGDKDEEYVLSPEPSTEPIADPRVVEGEPQSQIDQGPGSGYVDFGLDDTQAV